MLDRNDTGILSAFPQSRLEISQQARRSLQAKGDDNNQVSFVGHFAHGLPLTDPFFPNDLAFVHVQQGLRP